MADPRILFFVTCLLGLDGPPATGWHDGVSAYRQGDYDRAVLVFQDMLHVSETLAPFARFALANSLVQRGQIASRSSEMRSTDLQLSLTLYRELLDGPLPPSILRADLEHNLELTKFLWITLRREEKRRGKRESPSAEVADEERVRSNPASSHADSEEKRPPSPPSAKTQEDRGTPERAAAGFSTPDPGPLNPSEAQRRLRDAVARIRAAASPESPPRRAESRGDE